jgi:hypothetical protein
MNLQAFQPWQFYFPSFLILYTVGRTLWAGDQPVTRPLPTHRTTQTQNKRTKTSMPQMGIEPTTPVFKWAKTVHSLDGTATMIGHIIFFLFLSFFLSIYGPTALC